MADYSNQDQDKRINKTGKTYADLQKLADQQKWGEEKFIEGNEDSSETIPEFTKDTHYWMWLEAPSYDKDTGQRLDQPIKHCMDINQYNTWVKKNLFSRWRMKLIHDPTKVQTEEPQTNIEQAPKTRGRRSRALNQ